MNIVIFRRRFTPWSVDGTLVINGVFFSGTVEHPKKYMAAGRYKVAPVPIRFQKKIEVEIKETEEEKEKNKDNGKTWKLGGTNATLKDNGKQQGFQVGVSHSF